jgi:hypothetical protein
MLLAMRLSLVSPPPVVAGVAPLVAAEVAALVAAEVGALVAAEVAPAVGDVAGLVAAPPDAGVIFGVRTGVGSLSAAPLLQAAAPSTTTTDNMAPAAISRVREIILSLRLPATGTPATTIA